METQTNDQSFRYTYSAKEQEEIMRIRKKYAPADEEDAMTRLRRLDQSAAKTASVASIATGVIGTLIMGVGMCCAMVWQGVWFIPGILIGLVGIAVLACAYPIYNRIVKKQREKLAPEILRLTDELMK